MDSTFTAFDFLVFLAGAVWLVKKVAEGNRYHRPIVFILTAVLSCIVFWGFACLSLEVGILYSCY
jgi:hypothetical protein